MVLMWKESRVTKGNQLIHPGDHMTISHAQGGLKIRVVIQRVTQILTGSQKLRTDLECHILSDT